MPPIQFVDKAQAAVGASSLTFAAPTTVRAGDTYLAVMAVGSASPATPSSVPTGWVLIATLVHADHKIVIYRGVASDADPASLTVTYAYATFAMGVLLAYRGISTGTSATATLATIAASVNFACPSQTLPIYSDIYIGIVCVRSAVVTVTPPAGCTERFEQLGASATLETFDVLLEAAGATGAKTATTALAQSGSASSVRLSADGMRAVGKVITFDPPGAIGLPVEGI